MSITLQASSAGVTGQASVAVAYPTVGGGILAGDRLVIVTGCHPETPTFNVPAGWGYQDTATGGTGTAGADTGPARVAAFSKSAAGGETGSVTVSLTGATTGASGTHAWGIMYCHRCTSGLWSVVGVTGSDNTTGTAWSVTFGSDPGIASGDELVVATSAPTDVQPTWGSESITATGATVGAVTQDQTVGSATGLDGGGRTGHASCTAGTSTAAPVHAATLSGTTTNYAGPEVLVRLREIAAGATGIIPRTATVVDTASGTTVTGTRPTDRLAGDYVVAQFSMSCTVAQFTGPGGSWTQLVAPTANAANETVAVYGMFDPTSDPVGTSSAAAGRQTCLMQAFGGVDATTQVDVAAQTSTGTLPVAVTGVTTVTAGAMLLSGATGDFSTGAWTPPGGMTMVATHNSGVGRGGALAQEPRPSAGATGTRTWSATAVAGVGYTIALRPATAQNFTRTVDDPAGLTDSVTIASDFARSATDTAALTDAGTTLTRSVTGTEPVGLTDGVSVLKSASPIVADTLGLTDTPAAPVDFARTASDPAILTDTTTAVVGFDRPASDTLGLTDATTPVLTGGGTAFTRTVDDALGLTGTRAVDLGLTVTDPSGLTDADTSQVLDVADAIADALGLTDSVSVQASGGFARTADDSLGLTDSRAFAQSATPTDTLGLSDTMQVSTAGAGTRTVDDPAGLTDATAAVTTSARSPDDGLGLTDTRLSETATTRTDTLALTDTRAAEIGENPVDSLGLTDAPSPVMTWIRTVDDLLTLIDASGQAVMSVRTAADTLSLADSVQATAASVLSPVITDGLGLFDTLLRDPGRVQILTGQPAVTGDTARPGVTGDRVTSGVT